MFLADVVVVFATGNITGLNTSATPGPFLLALLAFLPSVISFFSENKVGGARAPRDPSPRSVIVITKATLQSFVHVRALPKLKSLFKLKSISCRLTITLGHRL